MKEDRRVSVRVEKERKGIPDAAVARQVLVEAACFVSEERILKKLAGKVDLDIIRGILRDPINQALIRKHRQEYLADVAGVAIYHKKERLVRLEKMWEKLDGEFGRNKIKPLTLVTLTRGIKEILSEARREAEGEGGDKFVVNFNRFSTITDKELQVEKECLLKRLDDIEIKAKAIDV